MSESDTQSLEAALASDEYEYVDVENLHKHPRNEEVYGEIDPDESFLEDIRQNGVETPLIVNEHEDTQTEWGVENTVIGGHRRLTAACEVGLNKVPVRWKEYPEPLATRRLVHNNKQREKSPGQETREMLLLEDTAREVAKERQGSRSDIPQNFAESGKGEWRDEVADEIGVSHETVRKGTDVYRFAYPDQFVHDDLQNADKYDVSEPVQEVAKHQAEHMDNNQQSYNGGHTAVKTATEIVEMVTGVDADMSETVTESLEELKASDVKPQKVKNEFERKVQRQKSQQADSRVQQQSNQKLRKEYGVSEGDLWIAKGDAMHRIYCGDAVDSDTLTTLIGDGVDVAYVDPPYGISEDTNRGEKKREGISQNYDFPEVHGDDSIEIAVDSHRVLSEFDIPLMVYWGANNYAHQLPASKGWIVWDKREDVESDDNSDFELAWTNQDRASRMYRHLWKGAIKASENNQKRIHPTQKPVALAEWVINDFARQDVESVLDPFAGSGSTLIAAERTGVNSYGVELSAEYVAATLKRLEENGCEIERGEV